MNVVIMQATLERAMNCEAVRGQVESGSESMFDRVVETSIDFKLPSLPSNAALALQARLFAEAKRSVARALNAQNAVATIVVGRLAAPSIDLWKISYKISKLSLDNPDFCI